MTTLPKLKMESLDEVKRRLPQYSLDPSKVRTLNEATKYSLSETPVYSLRNLPVRRMNDV
ncbi:MAG: hypothetical protein QMD85_00530 [Candidatus Aenigmarchaeota archaeon]|nr:hypothetical protein [Candidatus Aenigmarchaeota archaeon]MDI6722005.1 hypothetical protein [Candidatus Aenigmarchaeota archaeon]